MLHYRRRFLDDPTHRPAKLLLLLGLTLAAAAWQIVRLDRTLDIRSAADASTAEALARCRAAMLDLRAVERAYVAPGQDVRFWRDRAAADLETLTTCTGTLEAAATAAAAPPATQVAVAKLRAAVTATRRLDGRMADLAGTGLRDHAHDLFYGDAINTSVALEHELGAVEAGLAALNPGSAAAVRKQQAIAGLAAAGMALLVALVLARLPRARTAELARPETTVVPARDPAADAEDLPTPRLGERAASPAALAGRGRRLRRPGARPAAARAGRAGRAHARRPRFARHDRLRLSTRPTTRCGRACRPATRRRQSDGWARFRCPSDKPVAVAFTRGEARSVGGTTEAPGALVVPIGHRGGVAGVVTIELPPGNDRQPATLALTRIFAAQLRRPAGRGYRARPT